MIDKKTENLSCFDLMLVYRKELRQAKEEIKRLQEENKILKEKLQQKD